MDQPPNIAMKYVAAIFVILAVVGAIAGYGLMQLIENIQGGDPYYKEYHYGVTGTHYIDSDPYPCTGDGSSHNISETDLNRIFKITLNVTDDKGTCHIDSILMTDADDVPTPEFVYKGKDGSGYDVWTYTEDDTVRTFHIGEKCKVMHLEIASPEFHLTADVTD